MLGGLHFRRQQIVVGFVVDFYCHEASLAIEVDGEIHETQREYDAERDRILAGEGVRVLRVTNADVLQRLPETLERIAAACNHPQSSSDTVVTIALPNCRTPHDPSLPVSGRDRFRLRNQG
jgi:very-short-patch-repair endonuclease